MVEPRVKLRTHCGKKSLDAQPTTNKTSTKMVPWHGLRASAASPMTSAATRPRTKMAPRCDVSSSPQATRSLPGRPCPRRVCSHAPTRGPTSAPLASRGSGTGHTSGTTCGRTPGNGHSPVRSAAKCSAKGPPSPTTKGAHGGEAVRVPPVPARVDLQIRAAGPPRVPRVHVAERRLKTHHGSRQSEKGGVRLSDDTCVFEVRRRDG